MNATDIASNVGKLYYKYKKQLEESKRLNQCFSEEEAAYSNGYDSMLEAVVEDLAEILGDTDRN